MCCNPIFTIDLEIFKWFVDNKIIHKDDENSPELCVKFLQNGDLISFEKFKYIFELGFPCSLKFPIKISDIQVAEKILDYANEKKIPFEYTINFSKQILTIDFLKDYIDWTKKHSIKDKYFPSLYYLCFLGTPGLDILLENGYISPNQISFETFTEEVKQWLLEHGFTEFGKEKEVLLYAQIKNSKCEIYNKEES